MTICDPAVSTTPSAKELLAGFANKIPRQLTDLESTMTSRLSGLCWNASSHGTSPPST